MGVDVGAVLFKGPLEVRGHRVGRRVEGTSDASAEAVYRNNTAGASTTASSDPAQQREDEDDVEIGGSGDDHGKCVMCFILVASWIEL